MYKKKSFPSNAFPNLTNADFSVDRYYYYKSLTPKQKNILNLLKKGAFLLFDIKAKRAIVLQEVIDGVRALTELSVRMLSTLIRQGFIKVVLNANGKVHYRLSRSF